MNIVVLCNRDLASCIALNHLLPALLPAHRINLIVSARVGGSKAVPPELAQLKFSEQVLFNSLLWPLADGLPSAHQGELRSLAALAAATGQPLEEFNRLNVPPELDRFREMASDLVISIRYGVILKTPVLSVPRLGVLNLHSGPLPDYRGVMASFWALLNGEKSLGTTLHTIDDDSIDTGRIVATSTLPVNPEKSYLWHVLSLYEAGCANIIAAVNRLDQGEVLDTRPQPDGGSYFSFPDQAALEQFQQQGWRLVDEDDLLAVARRFIRSGETMPEHLLARGDEIG